MPQSLPDASISFPMLGDWSIDPPTYFKLGPLNIHFYGLIIATGFLLAVLYCAKRSKEFGMTPDNVYDVIILGVPMAVICSRIYYCAFHWESYRENPISVLYIWEGGLGMYGVIAGAILALIIYCRWKKLSIPAFLDMVCFGFIIGQTLGRWGNFMNREAFGYETDIFCRMVLTTPAGKVYSVHPTFLYESVWNLIGFTFMHFYSKKHRTYDGQMFLIYLAWYGFGRMLIEGLRTDSLYLWGTSIRVSQLVSAILFVASVTILLYNRFKRRPDPENMFVNRQKAANVAIVEGPAEAEPAAEAQDSGKTPEEAENKTEDGPDTEIKEDTEGKDSGE